MTHGNMKITEETRDRLLSAIRAGNTIHAAARKAGISPKTFYRWKALAKQGLEPFASFWERVELAEADCEAQIVEVWMSAIPKDWRAAAEFLRRRYPSRWATTRPNEDPEELAAQAEIEVEQAPAKQSTPAVVRRDPREHFRGVLPAAS